MTKSYEHHIFRAERLTRLLDSKFGFGKFRFGLDPLLGLLPGGDFAPLALSAYMIWIGHRIRLTGSQLFRMYANAVIDFVIGSIPIIGDLGDFFYRSHTKNLAILKQPPSSPLQRL